MAKQEIEELLKTVSDIDLIPIESVIGTTIADKYRELSNVPIDTLNKLIDAERNARDLPKIIWDTPERKREIFVADLLHLKVKVGAYGN